MLTEKQQLRHDLVISLIDKKGFKISSDYSYPFLRYVDELFKYILNGEESTFNVPATDSEQKCKKSSYPAEPLPDKDEDALKPEVKPEENPWAPFKTEDDFNAVLAMFDMVYKNSININNSVADSYKAVNGPIIDVQDLIKAFPNNAVVRKWIELDENAEKLSKFRNAILDEERKKSFKYALPNLRVFNKSMPPTPTILAASQAADPLCEIYSNMYASNNAALVDENTTLGSVEETSIPEVIDRGAIRGESEESLVVDEYMASNEKTKLSDIQSYEVSYIGSYGKPCFEIVSEKAFPIEGAKIIRTTSQLTDYSFASKQIIINHLISYFSCWLDSVFHGWLEECVKHNTWYDLNIEPHIVDQIV